MMKLVSLLVLGLLVFAVSPWRCGVAQASPGDSDEVYTAPAVRDPFAPFRPVVNVPSEPATPLEQIDLGALALKAVIWSASEPRAMVEDAAGQGYSLAVGTRVGTSRGVVVAIEPDRVTVEEQTFDYYGEKRTTARVLKLATE